MSPGPRRVRGPPRAPHDSEAHPMQRRRRDNGHSLADLGLILGLIAMVLIVALYLANGQVSSVLYTVSGSV